jgi:hypothetical protein
MLIYATFNMEGGEHMCCNTVGHHGFQRWGHYNACFCGCDNPFQHRPRFMTKEQRIAGLQRHLEILRNEVEAVEEHLGQIKKEN